MKRDGWPRRQRLIRASATSLAACILVLELALFIAGAFIGGYVYRMLTGRGFEPSTCLSLGVVAGLIYVYIAQTAGLYRLTALLRPASNLRKMGRTCAVALLTLTALLFLLRIGADYSRGASLIAAALVVLFCIAARLVLARPMRQLLAANGIHGRRVMVIGDHAELARVPTRFLLTNYGLQEVARLTLDFAEHLRTPARSDHVREILRLSRAARAEEIVVAAGCHDLESLGRLEQALRLSPLRVRLLPNYVYRTAMARHMSNDDIAARLIELQRAPMSVAEQWAKRLCDVAVAGLALVLLSPLFAMIAAAVKLDSPGPILFRQRRNGFNESRFTIYKFRTMSVLEDGAEVKQARRQDPRVTRIGRFLRRSSLDELPQLVNVLRGEMSVVGPRPHALAHDSAYVELIDDYCMRHHVKPGITGWAQVNGYRGETAHTGQMERRVELDIWYVNNRSLLLDLRIMLRTCFEVLSQDAY